MHGRINKLVYSHGFGFIHADDGQEVFFHRADLLDLDFHRLKEGQSIDFFLPHKAEDMQRAVIVRPRKRDRHRGIKVCLLDRE